MSNRYRYFFWAAIVLQFATAVFHTIGMIAPVVPANETERQLLELMDTYKLDAGAGFSPTMSGLFFALSSCFSLLCGFAGVVNTIILKGDHERRMTAKLLLANVVFFGILFVMMSMFTFLPPIVMSGATFLSLLISLILFKSSSARA